jgi:hypothetical protein
VYRAVVPFATEIVPSAAFPLVTPFTFHVIGAFPIPQKLAVKACVCPSARVAVPGEIELAVAQTIVSIALADFVASVTLVAVTVTFAGEGTFSGAVYKAVVTPPETAVAAIVPTVAFPPGIPPALSVTATDELPAPETVTVRTTEPLVGTLALVGLSDTEIAVGVCTGGVLSEGAEVCPHPESHPASKAVTKPIATLCRFLSTNTYHAMLVPPWRSNLSHRHMQPEQSLLTH